MLSNDILQSPWDFFDDIDEETKKELELSDILVNIASKIINYRLDNNITQNELAEKLNITQAMVSKLESGEYNPTIEFLYKIVSTLGWKIKIVIENEKAEDLLEYNAKPQTEKLIDDNWNKIEGYAS